MSQTNHKSFIESLIQTGIGTITGFILTYIIFPLFGVHTDIATISGITIAFMFVGILKNFMIRRLFNYMHNSSKIKFLEKKQKWNQSLFESIFQTVSGSILSFYLSIVIYPFFGLNIPTLKIGGITIAFTIASLIKNYFVRRYFEKISIN
jgi:uncharacterized membrane protein